jgi:hypothetical protein
MSKNTADKQTITNHNATSIVVSSNSNDDRNNSISSGIEFENSNVIKTPPELTITIEKSFEKILSYIFQGFLVGSVIGLIDVNRQYHDHHNLRQQQQQQQQQQSIRTIKATNINHVEALATASTNTAATTTTSSPSISNASSTTAMHNSISTANNTKITNGLSPNNIMNTTTIRSNRSSYITPLLYEKMAFLVGKRGGHLGLVCGLFASGLELSSHIRGEKKKQVDYLLTGAITGVASGLFDGFHLRTVSKHAMLYGLFGIVCYYSREGRDDVIKMQTDIRQKLFQWTSFSYRKENDDAGDVKDNNRGMKVSTSTISNNSVEQSSSRQSNNQAIENEPSYQVKEQPSNKSNWWW